MASVSNCLRDLDAGCGGKKELSVALLPRSVLVFSGEAYEECLHGIDQAGLRLDMCVCVIILGRSTTI